MKYVFMIEPDEFWQQFEEKMKEFFEGRENNYSRWMRSADVRQMLGISDSTLQTMRINGVIKSYRLGNTWFYRYDEIMEALENGKVGGKDD